MNNIDSRIPKFLFALFFIIGLENIDAPPLDGHDWRQTLTISMAKEYVKQPNILYPRTIIGEQQDILAAELPTFSYVLTCLYKVFGYQDWYGRIVNWIITVLGLFYFYKIIKKLFDDKIALLSCITLMSSIIFEFARKSMPDTFALSLNFIGIFYILEYFYKSKNKYLLLGFIFCFIGSMNKLSFINTWPILIVPFLNPDFKIVQKIKVSAVFSIIIILIYVWYFQWVPYLLKNGASQLFWPYSLTEGWHELYNLKDKAYDNLLTNTFHNKVIFYISILGLVLLLVRAKTPIKVFVSAYILIFILFCIKSGLVFPTHNYYLIPIVPILSLGVGFLFAQIKLPIIPIMILLFALTFKGFKHNHRESFNPHFNRYYLELPEIVNQFVPQQSKILVNGGSYNPNVMFWAGRKGWTYSQENFLKTEWINNLKTRGVEYVVQDKNLLKQHLTYPILFENKDWIIYKP